MRFLGVFWGFFFFISSGVLADCPDEIRSVSGYSASKPLTDDQLAEMLDELDLRVSLNPSFIEGARFLAENDLWNLTAKDISHLSWALGILLNHIDSGKTKVTRQDLNLALDEVRAMKPKGPRKLRRNSQLKSIINEFRVAASFVKRGYILVELRFPYRSKEDVSISGEIDILVRPQDSEPEEVILIEVKHSIKNFKNKINQFKRYVALLEGAEEIIGHDYQVRRVILFVTSNRSADKAEEDLKKLQEMFPELEIVDWSNIPLDLTGE